MLSSTEQEEIFEVGGRYKHDPLYHTGIRVDAMGAEAGYSAVVATSTRWCCVGMLTQPE